jgi:hypothetical protein
MTAELIKVRGSALRSEIQKIFKPVPIKGELTQQFKESTIASIY